LDVSGHAQFFYLREGFELSIFRIGKARPELPGLFVIVHRKSSFSGLLPELSALSGASRALARQV
jgi:hypothetical protein